MPTIATQRDAAKIAGLPEGIKPADIRNAAIIGQIERFLAANLEFVLEVQIAENVKSHVR